MHILVINGTYLPIHQHGTSVFTHNLSKALMNWGHKIFVLTTDVCSNKKGDVPVSTTVWDGVSIRYCHRIKCPIPYYSPEMARKVRLLSKEFDIALINSAFTGYGVLAGFECRKRGLPYIIYPHGSLDPIVMKIGRLKKKLWWYLFDKKLYNSASAVVALTEKEIEEIRNLGVNTRIEHIPVGVSIDKTDKASSRSQLEQIFPRIKGCRIILFFGRLVWKKGVDLLIDAFSIIRDKLSDTILVLAGPSEKGYDEEIKKKVSGYGLSDRIVLTGFLTVSQKWGFLNEADVFVLPSRSEGMPMAPLEALAAGTPVVLSQYCNLPEISEANAGIITSLDKHEIAEALITILSSNEIRHEMGYIGKKLMKEKYSWNKIAKKTQDLCKEIIEREKKFKNL